MPYTGVAGALDVRRSLCTKLARENGITASAEEIIVTNGAKQALYEALYAMTDPGDRVLIFKPHWPAYVTTCLLLGLEPVLVDQPDAFTPESLAACPQVDLVIINNPHNPTGKVYSKEELGHLCAWAHARGVQVIVDESYEHLSFGQVHTSFATLCDWRELGVVTIFSASQSYAMMGWRLGFALAPQAIAEAMQTLQGPITAATSHLAQVACAAAFDCGPQQHMIEEYRARRDAGAAPPARSAVDRDGLPGFRPLPVGRRAFAHARHRSLRRSPAGRGRRGHHAGRRARRAGLHPHRLYLRRYLDADGRRAAPGRIRRPDGRTDEAGAPLLQAEQPAQPPDAAGRAGDPAAGPDDDPGRPARARTGGRAVRGKPAAPDQPGRGQRSAIGRARAPDPGRPGQRARPAGRNAALQRAAGRCPGPQRRLCEFRPDPAERRRLLQRRADAPSGQPGRPRPLQARHHGAPLHRRRLRVRARDPAPHHQPHLSRDRPRRQGRRRRLRGDGPGRPRHLRRRHQPAARLDAGDDRRQRHHHLAPPRPGTLVRHQGLDQRARCHARIDQGRRPARHGAARRRRRRTPAHLRPRGPAFAVGLHGHDRHPGRDGDGRRAARPADVAGGPGRHHHAGAARGLAGRRRADRPARTQTDGHGAQHRRRRPRRALRHRLRTRGDRPAGRSARRNGGHAAEEGSGARPGRARTARGRPAQGRIPGDAGARAAQSAGADQHRRAPAQAAALG